MATPPFITDNNGQGSAASTRFDTVLPPWFTSTISSVSRWLILPFIGGIMYGIGEISAKEVLARKFQLGIAPSAHLAVYQHDLARQKNNMP